MIWKCDLGLSIVLSKKKVMVPKTRRGWEYSRCHTTLCLHQEKQLPIVHQNRTQKCKIKVHTHIHYDTGSAICVCVCVCVCALIHLKKKRQNAINSLAQSVFFFFFSFLFFLQKGYAVFSFVSETILPSEPESSESSVLKIYFTRAFFGNVSALSFLHTQH